VIRVMDPRPPNRNVPKKHCIPIPSHAVIWLRLVLLSPPPLPPSPSPASLSSIPPPLEVRETLVRPISSSKSTIISSRSERGDPKLIFKSPSNSICRSRDTRPRHHGGHQLLLYWREGCRPPSQKVKSPRDKLESQDIWGDNIHHLDQKAQILGFPPKQCNPFLLRRRRT
jgi:hypothetical protein